MEEKTTCFYDPEVFDGSPDAADRGSAPAGILGALLGALTGAVPWFLASTFANFFVGYLGFLVGLAACWGYRKFHGRRSTRFAMVTVVAASLSALLAAEAASWMWVLCSDPSWQADAARSGVSVAKLAFSSLLMPENWGVILPSLGVGMFIGVLGVLSARQKVLEYTDPHRAKAADQCSAVRSPAARSAEANAAAGLAVPFAFTVRERRGVKLVLWLLGAVCVVFFLGLLLFLSIGVFVDFDPADLGLFFTCAAVFGGMSFLGLFLICHARRTLAVEGETLSYLPTFGKARAFGSGDIAGMRLSANGRRLIGRDGRVLARFEDNQENSALLLQYLREREIGLIP